MRHRVAGKVLNADTQHRLAMRRNLASSLFLHGRVVTTTAKAKAARRFIEKLITRAKWALAAKAAGEKSRWLHNVRLLARDVQDKSILKILMADVAPLVKDRAGGYTRIVRDWKNQVGDNAPRAIFELVDKKPEAPEEGDAAAAGADAKSAKKGKAKAAPEKPKKLAKGATKAKDDEGDDE